MNALLNGLGSDLIFMGFTDHRELLKAFHTGNYGIAIVNVKKRPMRIVIAGGIERKGEQH